MKRALEPQLFTGLRPQSLLILGRGVSREEVKESLLQTGRVLGASAVLGIEDLCLRLVGLESDVLLTDLGRMERLKRALRSRVFRGRLPLLSRLKRGRGFFRKLDRALQQGRIAFAHEDEAQVFEARLHEREGAPNALREELKLLTRLYEAGLEDEGRYDAPRLIREAAQCADRWTHIFPTLDRVVFYGARSLSSAEHTLFERLPVAVEYEVADTEGEKDREGATWAWDQYQSFDDAAQVFAESLVQNSESEFRLRDTVVLIPDDPQIRETLLRALARAKVPLLDPRDPTELVRDERVKHLLLPLKLVALGGRREDLIAWCAYERVDPSIVNDLHASGLLRASDSAPESIRKLMLDLYRVFGGRKNFEGLRLAFRGFWGERFRILEPFFENLKEQWTDLDRPLPVRLWYEVIQEELPRLKPEPPVLRPKDGVVLHVVGQRSAPWTRVRRIVFFGWSEGVLDSGAPGDWWWSERDREILGNEFQVASRRSHRKDRIAVLREWVSRAERIEVWDAAYTFDGKERSGLGASLVLIGMPQSLERPVFRGGDRRLLKSRLPTREARVREVRLPMPERFRVSASGLDEYAKCGFIGLSREVWKLENVKEAGWTLWPQAKGILLHRAAEMLARSWDFDLEAFGRTPESVLDELLNANGYAGVFAMKRARQQVRSNLLLTLQKFCEDEAQYLKRSGSTYFALERAESESLEVNGVTIRGRMDRVDETHDREGLFVIDYKTSSSTPPAAEDLITLGKSVQLGVYAHALMRSTGRKVVGVQYIQLTPEGGRTRGILPIDRNGKKGSRHTLTETRSNNKSLVSFEDRDVWGEVYCRIEERVGELRAGVFDARPRDPSECDRCRLRDVCGESRRVRREASEDEE